MLNSADNNKKWLIDVADIKSIRMQIKELQKVDGEGILSDGWSESLQQLCELKYALDETSIIAVTDLNGVISYVNQKFCDISQYTKEELIGKTHKIVWSGYHPPEFFAEMWKQISTGKVWRQEICNLAKDGSIYWVDTTIVPFVDDKGKPYQYLAIRNETTDKILMRKALEDLLDLSIEKNDKNSLKRVCESLHELLGVSHVLINETKNGRGENLAGWTRKGGLESFSYKTSGTPCQILFDQDHLAVSDGIKKQFPNDEILNGMDVESYVGVALKKSSGEVIGNICVLDNKPTYREELFINIIQLFARRVESELERQQAITALQESEARVKAVIRSSADGILIIDENGVLESCNPAASNILKCCPVAVVGKSIKHILPNLFDGYVNFEERLSDLVGPIGLEVIKKLPSKSSVPLYVTVSEVKLDHHSLYTFTIRNLKEQKETEAKLQSAEDQLNVQTLFTQRLSALAAMAAGVAHELNQPLSGIRVYAQMINKFLETPESLNPELAQTTVGKIIAQVDRASTIIDHMREFSAEKSDRDLQLAKVTLKDVVESSLELIGQQLKSNGVIFTNSIDETLSVEANSSRLEQIFINLFSNAKDSIVEKPARMDEFIKVSSQVSSEKIELYVEDSGCGIPKEVQNNLFEPFVTSKAPGSGTGLGLSICVGILKDFDASISLVRTGESGTVFKLTFPRID
ncbi:MAG: PAS domain S-box protein [Lentisphaeraceae bacterium]|nr:PAS domain S-box protein [Lentisphaeraceae bacterium]